jgi:translin
MPLKDVLERIQEEMAKKDAAKQEVQAAMRKATRLSKQAIFLAHKNNLEEAQKTLDEAKALLEKLTELSLGYDDLRYMGIVDAAYEEYAEARIILNLVKNGKFVGFEDIEVPIVPYVLGLADVIGELRRRVLNLLRKGDVVKAEENLELMETTYTELMNLDEIHILVSGLRRKCDVARRVIEATRGDVTIEVRRSQLEKSIRHLEKALKVKDKK